MSTNTEALHYDCNECGRLVTAIEYHPFWYCVLQKAGQLDTALSHIATVKAEAEKKAIDTLAKAQLNMRPLIALKNGNGDIDGNWYVMYWDDAEQVWNKARYEDIVNEVKISLAPPNKETK